MKIKCISLLIFALLIFFVCKNAFAATSGPNSPGTITDNPATGTLSWDTPGNASAHDGLTTNATHSENGATYYSHYLDAENFGFSIPADATINGIVVEFSRWRSSANVSDNTIKLVKGGVVSGDNKSTGANWPNIVIDPGTYESFGSSSDLWGLSLTPNDVNASNFGVVLSTKNVKGGVGSSSPTARVDHIRITVYYTASSTPASASIPAVVIPPGQETNIFKIAAAPISSDNASSQITLDLNDYANVISIINISNSKDFKDGILMPFSQKVEWDLCKGRESSCSGKLPVYIQFIDYRGNVLSTQEYDATINAPAPAPETLPLNLTQPEIQAKVAEIQAKLIELLKQLIQQLQEELKK